MGHNGEKVLGRSKNQLDVRVALDIYNTKFSQYILKKQTSCRHHFTMSIFGEIEYRFLTFLFGEQLQNRTGADTKISMIIAE